MCMFIRMDMCLLEWVCVSKSYVSVCLHVVLEILMGGTFMYNYIPVYNTYSLVILICFISTGKELHKVEQQTRVDKKQQQVNTDVASILSRRIAFELSDSESGPDDSYDSDRWNG